MLGDKSRAIMLWNLLDGRAYTATELATSANISLQSASNHLKKLVSANILSVEKQGRHRYFKFANEDAAQVIESMASLISIDNDYKKIKTPKLNDFTYARTCYDHLAGSLGVKMTTSLLNNKIIKISDKNYVVTQYGKEWFNEVGVDINVIQLKKRSFAHQCLDWSERKHHIAGALGASLLEVMIKKDWLRKKPNSREVIITSIGRIELKNRLNLEV
ncbi:ArsR/SmtB family transcription factor [Tenacibaculum larymnensis]|uniref:Winged helix-turn-helix domain-containing protein n=1 Tax=Tenacibaculum larymnensis TaxID=2878201 RepID=A0A9X4EPY3_9FLAO|nr:winged helix-turn-helix domain-containing protein [Tenacibaculum larymnensis]MDE1207164.1 winged helix-turn-helix domain-containing protein [Tenacibaculum larymnensis]